MSADILQKVCTAISSDGPDAGRQILQAEYPFKPITPVRGGYGYSACKICLPASGPSDDIAVQTLYWPLMAYSPTKTCRHAG